ncbi:MAG TPA: polymer-forming cytoskeletal protein [Myxococcota bacterium]|jgi:cytoskeletal protein CcmA (bactofilin family)
MALKDFMARTPGSEPAQHAHPEPQPIAAPRPAAASPVHTTYLGPTITLSGEIRCGEPLRIDGTVKGEVHCDQLLTIGEKGCVHAAIEGDTVVIAGEVKGDITGRRKITLESTARVTGDLTTPGIVIQEGARLEGRIMIGGGPAPETAQATLPKPRAQEKGVAAPADVPARSAVIASGA